MAVDCFPGTLVIPGVSGSMMLMTMGYYYPVIGSVKNLITALVAFDIPQVIHICLVLIPFGIGVIVGIFAKARAILFKPFGEYRTGWFF